MTMLRIALAAALLLTALPVLADDKADLQQQLQASQQQLQASQARQQALAKQVSDIKQDLAASQTGLSRQTGMIRRNETKLTTLNASIDQLSRQNTDLTADLRKKYGSISNLVLALQRIRRIPPEALIARPGAPLATAQAAMVMQDVLPALAGQAASMQAQLDKLAGVRRDLASNRAEASVTGRALQTQYAQMQADASSKKALYVKTQNDYAQTQKDMARIAAQAGSVKDLLAKLAERERIEARKRNARPKAMPKAGIANLPVAGTVVTAFGDKTKIGAASTGISVRTSPGAAVTAPMGGIVKFAGSFRSYGQMVIVAHEDGYYSLIGGLGQVGVAVGQDVKAGQALGNMPQQAGPKKAGLGASSDVAPTLYYELRHDGRPVDPSTKLKDLRS